MCRSQKDIVIPAQAETSPQSPPHHPCAAIQAPPITQQRASHFSEIQIADDRAEIIRSNKNLLKRNLRNSLQMPRTVSILNTKEENMTAASLKDLGSDKYLAFRKASSQNTDSLSGSIKLVMVETQKIIEEVFDQKYEILKKIGQGAHSTVYKVLSKVDDRVYALKKIKNVSYQNWKKMKNHFRMVKLLDHPQIIEYTDFHFDEGKRTIFVVMQFCEETDLRSQICRRIVSGQKFGSQQILSMSRQLASVLKYLHSEGICHRDLKPENILYNSQTGGIRVIDLDVCGVKKYREQEFDLWTNTGTLLYRAPESFGVGYSEKVDVWSVGAMMYELVVGEVPLKAEYEKDFLANLKNEEVDFECVKTSKKVENMLRRCLEKDARKRVSAGELLDQLDSLCKSDESLQMVQKNSPIRKCRQEEDSARVCLGNILKFSNY